MVTILAFVFVLGIVVTLHELGHFLAAKAVGIRVEQFSIGFPPRAFGRRVGDTDYCISWIPLGGYVKMAGMIDESLEHPEKITGARDEFMSKNTWQKMLVISAGVIMNFLLAAGIYTGLSLVEGIPEVKAPIVDTVTSGMPAAEAGLEPGDRILSLDGVTVETWDALVDQIHARPDQKMTLSYERGGATLQAEVTPKREKTVVDGTMQEVGLIGISPRPEFRKVGFGAALVDGVTRTGNVLQMGLNTFKLLFTGQASVKDLGGPLAIAKWSGESAKNGMKTLVAFIAFISVNIGLLNILPIPALDGGHLALVVIEGVARRPLSVRIKVGIQQVGMVLLLGLMAIIMWNDLGRLGVFARIKELF